MGKEAVEYGGTCRIYFDGDSAVLECDDPTTAVSMLLELSEGEQAIYVPGGPALHAPVPSVTDLDELELARRVATSAYLRTEDVEVLAMIGEHPRGLNARKMIGKLGIRGTKGMGQWRRMLRLACTKAAINLDTLVWHNKTRVKGGPFWMPAELLIRITPELRRLLGDGPN